MPDDEAEKIEMRTMADQSISKSYKGILRIAHVKDLENGSKDEIFNPTYYGNPTQLISLQGNGGGSEIGYQSATRIFDGTIARYNTGDSFTDKVAPVTDSVGNYLNWGAGETKFTIGSCELINGHVKDFDNFSYVTELHTPKTVKQESVFPVLSAETIVVGMQNRELSQNKTLINKKASINIQGRSDGNGAAEIVINNYYDHSNPVKATNPSPDADPLDPHYYNEDNQGKRYYYYNYERPEQLDATRKPVKGGALDHETRFRTVLRDTKPGVEQYDAFIYHQDHYDYHNYHDPKNDQSNKYVDAVADVENIVNYVKKKVDLYNSSRTVEVPTGTVIWQYVSLAKWYNLDQTATGNYISKNNYPGNSPSMNYMTNSSSTDQSAAFAKNPLLMNNIQGVCRGNNHVIAVSSGGNNSNTFFTLQCEEVIPLYKRDYTLCDGSQYTISCYRKSPDTIGDDEKTHFFDTYNEQLLYDSYDRFINLFFSVGYWYTPYNPDESNIMPHFIENGLYRKKLQTVQLLDDEGLETGGVEVRQEFEMPESNKYGNSRAHYQYTDRPIKEQLLVENFDGVRPGSHKKWKYEIDHNVFFGCDLVKLVTYRLITQMRLRQSSEVANGGNYNGYKTQRWLKHQKFDSSFIFNTLIGWRNSEVQAMIDNNQVTDAAKQQLLTGQPLDGEHQFVIEHKYDNDSIPGTEGITMLLGREVNTYMSPILTLNFDYESGKWSYLICCLYELAEVNDVIDSMHYITVPRYEKLYFEKYHQVKFRVPNFMNDNSGSFIGSTMYTWRDEEQSFTQTKSWSPLVGSELPHRHSVYRGSLSPYAGHTDANANYPGFRIEEIGQNNRPAAEACQYRGSGDPAGQGHATWQNYVITEPDYNVNGGGLMFHFVPRNTWNFMKVNELQSDHPIMKSTGMFGAGTDVRFENAEPTRAASSGPVNEVHFNNDYNYYWNGQLYLDTQFCIKKTGSSSPSYGVSTSAGWGGSTRAETFLPQSVSMLPLIKL